MSDLIIIGYDDHAAAQGAYKEVQKLHTDLVVQLSGLALVTVDEDGKQHVETPAPIVGASASSGALWGVLVGMLFLAPGVGMLMGGAIGALTGKMAKTGINAAFRERVVGMLTPGKAAVVIMASKITEDKFGAAMGPFGGQVLQTSLSDEAEAELAAELGNE